VLGNPLGQQYFYSSVKKIPHGGIVMT